jgi:uroporphyrinogen-III synthase
MILQGKVLISTVSTHKSGEIRSVFEPLGATVIDFPMTEIIPVEVTADIQNVIGQLEKFNWIIFTSANGVIHFYRILSETGMLSKIPDTVKIGAVGVKTALELEKTGRIADFTGSGNTAEKLIEELIEKEPMQNCHVLLPLGNLAPPTIEQRLSGIAAVKRITIYATVKAPLQDDDPLRRIKTNRYDLVLFTSPSGVDHFVETMRNEMIVSETRVASIGMVTTRSAQNYGMHCLITATKSTYEGLADEIVNYYTIKNY